MNLSVINTSTFLNTPLSTQVVVNNDKVISALNNDINKISAKVSSLADAYDNINFEPFNSGTIDLENYYTKSQVNNISTTLSLDIIDELKDVVRDDDLTSTLENYCTKEQLQNLFSSLYNNITSNYCTKANVNTFISSLSNTVTANYYTKNTVNSISSALNNKVTSDYYNKSTTNNLLSLIKTEAVNEASNMLNNKFKVMSQEQYDELDEIDPAVFYFITDSNNVYYNS